MLTLSVPADINNFIRLLRFPYYQKKQKKKAEGTKETANSVNGEVKNKNGSLVGSVLHNTRRSVRRVLSFTGIVRRGLQNISFLLFYDHSFDDLFFVIPPWTWPIRNY